MAMREAGVICSSTVIDAVSEPVGAGLVGNSVRFRLVYDRAEPGAPNSVIGKFPSASAESRAVATREFHYLREVRFYEHLAATADLRTPRAFYAQVEPSGEGFTLLLEDLAPAVEGDLIAGCTPDRAALVLEQAAALHASRWGDPTLFAFDWLHVSGVARLRRRELLMPLLYAGFQGRYGKLLEPKYVAIGEQIIPRLGSYYATQREPWTIQHGDFRLDNMLFDACSGEVPMAVVDWQTVSLGPAVVDVAYFLGSSLSVDERRAHEQELVRQYHASLIARNVKGYPWERCWEDYRRYAFEGYLMAVGASMVVERTPRSDEMFLTMARRHGAHVLDAGSASLLWH